MCASCEEGYFPSAGGLCALCPTDRVTLNFFITTGVTFCVIACVAIFLVVVVQSAFGRDFKSGAGRAISFAAWVVSALRTQAQIGRTASSGQPAVITEWYRFLLIFEANPSGARPSQCTSSMAMYPIVVMSISITCALLFVLLGTPCVRSGLTTATGAVIRLAREGATCGGAASEEEKEEEDDEHEAIASVLGISGTGIGANPMLHRGAIRTDQGIELTEMNAPRPRALSLTDSTRVAAKRALAAHRLKVADAAAAEKIAAEKTCCCRRSIRKAPLKSSTELGADKAAKTKTDWAATVVGLGRKSIGGFVLMLHPVVANKAFRSIYCVRIAPGGPFVLATELSRECFGPSHLGVFILAVATIMISIVGFPIFVMAMLSTSARWCEPPRLLCAAATPPPPPPLPPLLLSKADSGSIEGDPADGATHCNGAPSRERQSASKAPGPGFRALTGESERATDASNGAPSRERQSAYVALSRRCTRRSRAPRLLARAAHTDCLLCHSASRSICLHGLFSLALLLPLRSRAHQLLWTRPGSRLALHGERWVGWSGERRRVLPLRVLRRVPPAQSLWIRRIAPRERRGHALPDLEQLCPQRLQAGVLLDPPNVRSLSLPSCVLCLSSFLFWIRPMFVRSPTCPSSAHRAHAHAAGTSWRRAATPRI